MTAAPDGPVGHLTPRSGRLPAGRYGANSQLYTSIRAVDATSTAQTPPFPFSGEIYGFPSDSTDFRNFTISMTSTRPHAGTLSELTAADCIQQLWASTPCPRPACEPGRARIEKFSQPGLGHTHTGGGAVRPLYDFEDFQNFRPFKLGRPLRRVQKVHAGKPKPRDAIRQAPQVAR